MKTMARPAPAGVNPLASYEQLDTVLRQLVAEHEKLLVQTGEHRRAILSADAAALGASMGVQQTIFQRITALERQRQVIVAGIGRMDPRTARLSELAGQAPEPVRGRLLGVAQTLRDVLNAVHEEHVALRRAAETLSMHMEGLLRQVCRGLSHTGTYARRGAVDAPVQVVSAVDLRS